MKHKMPTYDKKNTRLIISQVILDTFKALKMSFPETSAKRQQELLSIQQQLMDESNSSDWILQIGEN